ncbi:MAG: hypothetical protein EBR86_13105 [Planctomycetia bacterium]|nr:hypothetical protein [Planctomycetia bacterium]
MTTKRAALVLGLVCALAAARPATAGGIWIGGYGPPVVGPVPFGLAGAGFVGGFVPVAPVVVARPVVPVITPVAYYAPAPVIVASPAPVIVAPSRHTWRHANRVYRRNVLWGW